MFKIFKKKSSLEKLEQKFEKLVEQSFQLSTVNRSESDRKYVEAQAIMSEIEKMKS